MIGEIASTSEATETREERLFWRVPDWRHSQGPEHAVGGALDKPQRRFSRPFEDHGRDRLLTNRLKAR